MARFPKGVLLLLAAGCLLLGLGLLVFRSGPAAAIQALPNPNGYDDFLRAGELVTSGFPNYEQAGLEELRREVMTNATALNLVRTGLAHECRVPVDLAISNRLDSFGNLKKLGRGLLAQARLAQHEQESTNSVEPTLTAIRFGQEIMRGGLIIDALVGLAVEGKALEDLSKVAPQLDAKACKQTAAALMRIDASRPEIREVINQENAWASRVYGLRGQVTRLITYKQIRATEQKFSTKYKAQQARFRQLATDLAARAFELETQARPRNVNDLVPDYLPSAPAGVVVR